MTIGRPQLQTKYSVPYLDFDIKTINEYISWSKLHSQSGLMIRFKSALSEPKQQATFPYT